MRKTVLSVSALSAAALLVGAVQPASAATVGYWRFEDSSFLEDSGTNDLDLTANTTLIEGKQSSSAKFPNPVFPTNVANTGYFSNSTGANRYAEHADDALFNLGKTMTIEGLVNADKLGETSQAYIIASQYMPSNNNRSWSFGIIGGNLSIRFGSGISGNELVSSSFTFETGKVYYTAAAVDLNQSKVTFYYKNLTDSGSLLSSVASTTISTLNNSTAPLRIGSQPKTNLDSEPTTNFKGYIDEVRLSNTTLTSSELLIVPEPASVGLFGLLGLGALARRRRTNA